MTNAKQFPEEAIEIGDLNCLVLSLAFNREARNTFICENLIADGERLLQICGVSSKLLKKAHISCFSLVYYGRRNSGIHSLVGVFRPGRKNAISRGNRDAR